jgi:hypothetical protein
MLNITDAVVVGLIGSVLGWFGKMITDYLSEKRLFDNRIRLEKEYELYIDLWDKLFELRRAIGQLVNPLSSTSTVCHAKDFFNLFNAYQAAVRKGEPFVYTSIFVPAREIVQFARNIDDNIRKQKELSERLAKGADSESLTNNRIRLDEENNAAFKEI